MAWLEAYPGGDGRTDGRTDGNKKCPSIVFIFKYVNKYDVLFQKMFLKVVNHFFLTFKIWDEVGDGGDQFSKSPYVREF